MSVDHWGQGLMHEVLQTVLPFGFAEMGLAEIYADVEPENERSANVLVRLGFRREPQLVDGQVRFRLDV